MSIIEQTKLTQLESYIFNNVKKASNNECIAKNNNKKIFWKLMTIF